jgi:hypothetical protein
LILFDSLTTTFNCACRIQELNVGRAEDCGRENAVGLVHRFLLCTWSDSI